MEKVRGVGRSGQAVVEYILLIAVLVLVFSSAMKRLEDSNVMVNLQKPFTSQFKYTYRYGHPEARGQDDGGPVNIPQYSSGEENDHNFRIFINPSKK
jgi:hypothetical protein